MKNTWRLKFGTSVGNKRVVTPCIGQRMSHPCWNFDKKSPGGFWQGCPMSFTLAACRVHCRQVAVPCKLMCRATWFILIYLDSLMPGVVSSWKAPPPSWSGGIRSLHARTLGQGQQPLSRPCDSMGGIVAPWISRKPWAPAGHLGTYAITPYDYSYVPSFSCLDAFSSALRSAVMDFGIAVIIWGFNECHLDRLHGFHDTPRIGS